MALANVAYLPASGQHHRRPELVKQDLDREISSSLSLRGQPPGRYSADEAEISTGCNGLEDV